MTLKDVLLSVEDQILGQQHAIDEAALNDIALIATLKELLPDFEKRFDYWRSGAEKVCVPGAAQEIEALRREIGKLKSN